MLHYTLHVSNCIWWEDNLYFCRLIDVTQLIILRASPSSLLHYRIVIAVPDSFFFGSWWLVSGWHCEEGAYQDPWFLIELCFTIYAQI